MIPYAGLNASKPSYLNREMTGRAAFPHKATVLGAIEKIQGDELSQTLLSAITNPVRWNDVCRLLVEENGLSSAVMFPLFNPRGPIYASASGEFKVIPPVPEAVSAALSAEQAIFVREPQSRWQHSWITVLTFGHDGQWIVRLTRSHGTASPDSEDLEKLRQTAAKLSFAATSYKIVSHSALEAAVMTFQQAGRPYAILDDAYQILAANAHFSGHLQSFFRLNSGVLAPANTKNAAAFRQALGTLATGQTSTKLLLHDDYSPCLAMLHAVPFTHCRISAKRLFGLELRGTVRAKPVDSVLLKSLFGLTRREAEVVALLASGKGVAAISETHGVSVGTVRVQLKAIFRKMGVGSQVDLVTKVLGICL